MPVVSFSLNESILEEVDRLRKSLGFPSRSEVVRASIHNILAEKRQPAGGRTRVLLLVTHHERFDEVVTGMRHNFEDLVTTHLHSKIDAERCMEFFVLAGDANGIKKMRKEFEATKSMNNVMLVVL